ncbi:hypothetical protein C8F04DRAFT_1132557 [Mycena alexandri]|uniref:Uncharacterized protein n=1 Tax=Mycena alexandri TaxID=1745969 RepID=A0AAD6WR49_9AGAR|nr:hypothetical protein C8F04DRAFT_1132557 [Mycena alexandri]
MPIPRRASSNTTHVSDSEPEREALRRNSLKNSSPPNSPRHRAPLSSISNTLVGTNRVITRTVEARLSKLENDIGEIKRELRELKHNKRSRCSHSTSPPSTPVPKRPRTVQQTPETPILRSSLMVSTPERDALARWVSNDLQQSLREGQRRHLNRKRVAPGPSRRGKLRRRAHELDDM